jgi:uncharacterized protein YlxW (UPF0749 family)
MAQRPRSRPALWRWGTPLVLGLCGTMLWSSYANSDGTQWRSERYTELASLVEDENAEVTALNERVSTLTEQVADLTGTVDDRQVQQFQDRESTLRPEAGLTAVTGPGVTVTLSDAPTEVVEASELEDLNLHVVHQQDVQRVVNALWAGGAEALTIQGQRVVSTTGIKCEGNAIQIQGVAYPQPFVIQGVGDQTGMLAALERDPYLQRYRDQADDPRVDIGWTLDTQTVATAPAYDGALGASYASPME